MANNEIKEELEAVSIIADCIAVESDKGKQGGLSGMAYGLSGSHSKEDE